MARYGRSTAILGCWKCSALYNADCALPNSIVRSFATTCKESLLKIAQPVKIFEVDIFEWGCRPVDNSRWAVKTLTGTNIFPSDQEEVSNDGG